MTHIWFLNTFSVLIEKTGWFATNAALWSISAEWFAYLLLPLFIWASFKQSYKRVALIWLVFAVIFEIVMSRNEGGLNYAVFGLPALVRISFEFFTGCILCLIHKKLKSLTNYSNQALVSGLFLLVVFSTLPIAIYSLVILSFCLILHSLTQPNSITHLLQHRIMIWLGEVSFSLYMVHWLILKVMTSGITDSWIINHQLVFSALYIGLTLIISAVLHTIIELPIRNRLRKWAPKATPVGWHGLSEKRVV